MFLRKWPTEDFGTFIHYFQRHYSILDVESVLKFDLQNLFKKVPTGVTRKLFEPLSHTFFGKIDDVADLEQWILST